MAQPIFGAYVAFPVASPSVDGRVSDLHLPLIFWAWGEGHAPSLGRPIPADGECDPGYESLTETGPATLAGTLVWTLGNKSIGQELAGDSPDPLQMPAFKPSDWEALQTQEGPNRSAVLPNLTLDFEGQVKASYVYFNQHFEKEAGGLAGGSGGQISNDYYCRLVQTQEVRTYTRAVSAQANWSVEQGQPLWMLVQPAGGEQLSWQPQAQVAVMANRQQERGELETSSGNWSSPEAEYADTTDEWGLITIHRIEITPSQEMVDIHSPATLSSNSTFAYLQPDALDAQSRAYAWQFAHHLQGGLPLGRTNLTAHFYDEFGDEWQQDWKMYTRAGSGIVMGAEGAKAVLTDSASSAPEIKQSQIGAEGTAPAAQTKWGAVVLAGFYEISGSDTVRPTQAVSWKPGPMPALAGWLPLGVVILLGYAWIEWMG